MKYIIDFCGNVMAEIEVVDSKIKVIQAMDGYGQPIDVDKITIKESEVNNE